MSSAGVECRPPPYPCVPLMTNGSLTSLPNVFELHSQCQPIVANTSLDAVELQIAQSVLDTLTETLGHWKLANKAYRCEFDRLASLLISRAVHFLNSCVRLDDFATHEAMISHLLRLHIHVLESRTLFDYIPQAYLYHSAYVRPYFEKMSLEGGNRALLLTSNFLWLWFTRFTDSVLPSPHWFLHMMALVMEAILERGCQERNLSPEQVLTLCNVINEFNRISVLLFTPERRQDLSRVVRLLLERYVIKICVCSSLEWKGIYPTVRKTMESQSVAKWVKYVDAFVLKQLSRALKPGPREILRVLVEQYRTSEEG